MHDFGTPPGDLISIPVVDYLSHIWDVLALCKLDESLNACTLDLNVRGVFEASARCFSIDVDIEAASG